jgi:malonate-semialdehyde dehydrogenase (acetylating)/methylmalonate-semialdehyde dehydrogenase
MVEAMSSQPATLAHYLDGAAVPGGSGRVGDVFNPALGELSCRVPLANREEVSLAVASATGALPAWAATPPAQRAQILFRYLGLLQANADSLAELISAEHGKMLADAKGALARGIEVVEFACGIPQLLKGEFAENVAKGMDSYSVRQPVGVCVGITPFNFPAMVPMWMFPVALACGNSFILKPSEKVPSAALRLAELASEAGLPDGVLNVVHGDGETVDALITDPRVAAISFVGSAAVGWHIYTTGCAHGKRVQALCSAKNHMVIMPDADVEHAVDALLGAAYGSAGERCMAVSVAVPVGEAVADALVERLVPKIESLRVGPCTDPEAQMGPLVTRQHLERVKSYIEVGVAEGAELLVDGRDLVLQGYEQGYFLGGSLFDRVSSQMRIYREEIFGPVLCMLRASDYDEALTLVNEHEYGNGAALFSQDGDCARDFANRVQSGMVGINVPIPVPLACHSFGGWKGSLLGDHFMYGPEGVRFFTRLKTVTATWPSSISRQPRFHFHRGSEH